MAQESDCITKHYNTQGRIADGVKWKKKNSKEMEKPRQKYILTLIVMTRDALRRGLANCWPLERLTTVHRHTIFKWYPREFRLAVISHKI